MMYPLSENLAFNPIRDRWFEVILQDETWFFTIIYVAARQLEAEHGANQSSQQVSRLMNHVLGRLKDSVERARQGHAPPDSVIGAVSCLVSLEVCRSCYSIIDLISSIPFTFQPREYTIRHQTILYPLAQTLMIT